MNRRQFLQRTWYSGLLISGSGIAVSLSGCSTAPDMQQGFKVLRNQDLDFFRAILSPCLPQAFRPNPQQDEQIAAANTELQEQILLNYDHILSLVNPDAKKEFLQLMDLLNTRLTRGLLTGIWSSWHEAAAKDIDKFLWSWRNGSFNLLTVAYVSITTMLSMAAYQIPSVTAEVGYYGPPRELLLAWQQ